MKNELYADQIGDSAAAVRHRVEIGLPLTSLSLNLVPAFVIWISPLMPGSHSSLLLIALLSPITGFFTGIKSLRRGKSRIGIMGMILAVAAIALPVAVIAYIIKYYIG